MAGPGSLGVPPYGEQAAYARPGPRSNHMPSANPCIKSAPLGVPKTVLISR